MLAFGLRFSIAILNKKHIDVHNMIKENVGKELKKAYSIEKEDIDFKSNESDPSSGNGNYLLLPSFPPSFNNGGIRFCRRYNNYTMILVIALLYVHPNYLTFSCAFFYL